MSNSEKCYYNLTHPQKRIWYIDKVNMGSPIHNIGGCLKINESIDIVKMREAINVVIEKNDGLRLRFIEKDGQPFQYIHKYEKENIDFQDFCNYNMPLREYKKWSESIFKKSFTLENNRLYYFAIYKISEEEYGLLLNIHHIISDGWSISLILKQICEIYSNLVKANSTYYVENYSYADFIQYENDYMNSVKFINNRNFWIEKFHNLPEEFLYRTSNSIEGNRDIFNIDGELTNKIRKFIDDRKCSMNTFFMSILLIYLNKITYKEDLVIGTPIFNRSGKKQKSMVGMFTSTVPFRFALDINLSIDDLIKSITRELKTCLINQKYPYDLLIKDLSLSKGGYDSLFKMSVNYYNTKFANDIDGIDVEVQEYYCGSQSYSLQLTIKEWEHNNITLNYDYKIEEYSASDIRAMHRAMLNIINKILNNENIAIKDIKLLSEKEINYKVHTLNSTQNAYPNKTVYELFEEQANLTPNEVALEFKEKVLTYKELNEKSNQLANYLREKGVKKGSIVGIMMTHTFELVIGILGVLKAGAAYIPIDTNYPIERINYVLQDSESHMILTNFQVEDELKFSGDIINLSNVELNEYSKETPIKLNGTNELAYIIYTSGSTGKPKGVMIEHRGLVNYIWWAKKMYLKDKKEVVALYSSISFDLTVTSIFTPLVSGNKIVIYDNDETEFVLYKILREKKATVLKLTPAHLTLLKDRDNSDSSIKRFIVGGEDLKVNLAKEIYHSFGKNIEIYNEYGPTETVVGCMIYKYDEEMDRGTSVPIGRPIDNAQIYILDSDFNIVPTGVIGEIYVSGDGVARGYLNREHLTKERFIKNPFIEGKRMYKTGDTARYLESGDIEYIGRIDNQVKIRGHRIELGEIEKYLLENESVKEAVVVFKEDDLENKLLNAYVVCKSTVTDSELKDWLMKFLPKYMMPNNFIFLEQLPLTVNGKVNYDLLPKVKSSNKEFLEYKTDAEKELVKVIQETLGIQNISLNDNYYQIGGDSIKAIQISSKLKNIGLELKAKDILTYDSIKEIAAAIEVSESKLIINQDVCKGDIDNTPILDWFFSQEFSNENNYNQYILLELNNPLNINNVTSAVNKLIEHHDTLRINYNKEKNKLYYNNDHMNERYQVECVDLTNYSYDMQYEFINNDWKVGFDIEKSLLFNITIFNLGDNKQALLFTAHHLIVDGVSWRILLNDFFTVLSQLSSNNQILLPMKTNSFKEWGEQLQLHSKNDFEKEKIYWNSIFDNKFTYPVDFNEGADTVKTSSTLSNELDEETIVDLIKKANEIYNIDFNEILLISLVITISDITNSNEIIIELERHGREYMDENHYLDVSRTVGWFTSIYPAHFEIYGTDVESKIKSIKEQIRSIPNKGFNYGVLKYLNRELIENDNKHIRFNYLGDFDNIINRESVDISNIDSGLKSDPSNELTALIDISAMIINKKLKISATYSNNRFKCESVQKLINDYIDTVRQVLNCCDNKFGKDFTPSDFEAADISQADLDSLFN